MLLIDFQCGGETSCRVNKGRRWQILLEISILWQPSVACITVAAWMLELSPSVSGFCPSVTNAVRCVETGMACIESLLFPFLVCTLSVSQTSICKQCGVEYTKRHTMSCSGWQTLTKRKWSSSQSIGLSLWNIKKKVDRVCRSLARNNFPASMHHPNLRNLRGNVNQLNLPMKPKAENSRSTQSGWDCFCSWMYAFTRVTNPGVLRTSSSSCKKQVRWIEGDC